MKLNLLLTLLFLSFNVLYSQDSTTVLSQEVTYYKTPQKQTQKHKKAYLKKVNTIYKDSTCKEEMIRLSDGLTYYRRVFKGKQPFGTWIETTKKKQELRINTENIDYCLDRDSLNREEDTTVSKVLINDIYTTIVSSIDYPVEAISLKLSGTVYLHFELTTQNQIKNGCVTKSIHPILDLASLQTINGLKEFNNPLERNINFSIPLKYKLR